MKGTRSSAQRTSRSWRRSHRKTAAREARREGAEAEVLTDTEDVPHMIKLAPELVEMPTTGLDYWPKYENFVSLWISKMVGVEDVKQAYIKVATELPVYRDTTKKL